MTQNPLLQLSRPVIMGVLNVTPDSFSDGGLYFDEERAVAHGLKLAGEGADIIDVGGESSRPGAARVSAEEEKRRVVPVIKRLRQALPGHIVISIDTTLVHVAEPALEVGAGMLNDISAGREDPAMFRLAADSGVPIVLMHMQGTPETMQDNPSYQDVVVEVPEFLKERAEAAQTVGVSPEAIILDPGIGFGKRQSDNLALLAHLDRLVGLGYLVLLGTSRKSFLKNICQTQSPSELVPATCATTALGIMAGVRLFRVHDVAENRQAADVAWAIKKARQA